MPKGSLFTARGGDGETFSAGKMPVGQDILVACGEKHMPAGGPRYQRVSIRLSKSEEFNNKN